MFTATQNPVLEFLSIALAIVAGFVFVYDARSPVAKASFVSRCAAMLAVIFVTANVLDRFLVWFSPVFNGANTSAAALEFFGGILLLAGLALAVLVLHGDLKVHFDKPVVSTRTPPVPSYPQVPTSTDVCAQCGSALKPDALFCMNCGARTPAIA
jgi:hypothetical protein